MLIPLSAVMLLAKTTNSEGLGVKGVFKAILAVLGCALLGMALGGGIGYLLGHMAPDFISAILPLTSGNADFVQIGVGLGVVSGSLLGTVVGTIVIGILIGIRFTKRDFENQTITKK